MSEIKIIKDKYCTLKEFSDKSGISPQVLSNWKSRKTSEFPEEQVNKTYLTEDLIGFAIKSMGVPINVVYKPYILGQSISLTMLGRARTGKDYIASTFVNPSKSFIRVFCGDSDDKTRCVEKISIVPDTENFVRFSINIEKIKDKITDEEYKHVQTMVKHKYSLDEDELQVLIEDTKFIEELSKKVFNDDDKTEISDDIVTEITVRPSEMCKEILDKLNMDWMKLTVYPGLSDKINVKQIEKSDLFIFVLRAENSEEQKRDLSKIAVKLKPYCADAKAMVMYYKRGLVSSEDRYDSMQKDAESAFERFEDGLEPLRESNSIVDADLSILRIFEQVLFFPDMDSEEPSATGFVYEQYSKRMVNKISKLLENQDYKGELIDTIKKYGIKSQELIVKTLKGLPCKLKIGIENPYTLAKGKYRVYSYAHDVYYSSLFGMNNKRAELYNYFATFKTDEYPEEWQQRVIQCLYKLLSSSTRNDEGIGTGCHHFEKQPPITMRAEESLAARELLKGFENNELSGQEYVNVLANEVGVKSDSWNRVSIEWDSVVQARMLKRLKLISELLENYGGSDLNTQIETKQVLSSRILTEIEILMEVLDYSEDQAVAFCREAIESQAKNP